jgi:hypothetical protein
MKGMEPDQALFMPRCAHAKKSPCPNKRTEGHNKTLLIYLTYLSASAATVTAATVTATTVTATAVTATAFTSGA